MSGEAQHGGVDAGELIGLGLDPATVVDLSSNVLRVEHPTVVRDAIASAAVETYPDRDCVRLRHALAERYRVPFQRIVMGNGCSELIHIVAQAFLKHRDRVLVVGPTFAEYQRASELAGAHVVEVRANADEAFAVPLEAIEAQLDRQDVAMVWICNPNNPTGQTIPAAEICELLLRYPKTTFVVDESYIEFSLHTSSLIAEEFTNLIVLRSMTKCYALAGLRLGFAVAVESMIHALCSQRVPWSVSAVAQSAGLAVLEQREHYVAAMSRMWSERDRLWDKLRARGDEPLESDTGFFLLPVDDSAATRDQLLLAGVLVRDTTAFGLPGHVRIAVTDRTGSERLLDALDGRESGDVNRMTSRNSAPQDCWNEQFRSSLHELFRMRRDVRRFKTDAIADGAMQRLIDAACLAPSVGLCQPWRFVSVRDSARRQQLIAEFEAANAHAASQYDTEAAAEYQRLKLSGLREAPEHLAVFIQPNPEQGRGLGRQTMPETVAYSVVAAIQNFWLAARAENIGVGWVSIWDPHAVRDCLDVPDDWQLIAYLCVGYPLLDSQTVPELERDGWQERTQGESLWHR
jgi:5,6-dimethylbenzimidazole synthase